MISSYLSYLLKNESPELDLAYIKHFFKGIIILRFFKAVHGHYLRIKF